MEKINFINGQEPALNSTNLNQMQTNIETAINDKNIISASWTNSYIIKNSDTYEQIPLNSKVVIGNKLTLNSAGKIVIGSGITKVLVSAKLQVAGANLNPGGKNFVLRKNGSIVARSMFYVASANNTSKELTPRLIEVREGDLIDIAYYGKTNEEIGSDPWSYVTVEAII